MATTHGAQPCGCEHAAAATAQEQILVVKREHFFPQGTTAWQGLSLEHLNSCLEAIGKHGEFQPRSCMEEDTTFKQIIPYLVFQYQDKFFLMQRAEDASEKRLQNKYSLGIGGHMRLHDLQQGPNLFDWAQREFNEEVSYEGKLDIIPLGVLNDDSTSVGQVHIGLVLMLIGDSDKISIKSEMKSGRLVSLHECLDHVPMMENWSQMVLMTLLKESLRVVPNSMSQSEQVL
jgi:predicted NUDIX family phosphoesterase